MDGTARMRRPALFHWMATATALIVIAVLAVVTLSSRTTARSGGPVRTVGSTFSPSGGLRLAGAAAPAQLTHPVVGSAPTPSGQGYWLVAGDGGVFTYGDASFLGSTGGLALNQAIVGMAATPSGHGYWLVAADGGVFNFGDAGFYGSTGGLRLNQTIVGMAATPDGHGYWLAAADGGVFSFGDAAFYGSTGGVRLNQPIVGVAAASSGHGYWFVASDGGVFNFGAATFAGSAAGLAGSPVVGMAADATGHGYWIASQDGAVYSFGDAHSLGSAAGLLGQPAAALVAAPSGQAMWIASRGGATVALPGQSAPPPGAAPGPAVSPAAPATSASYTFMKTNSDGSPVRWDPCQPIHYVANFADAPATAASDLAGAISRLAAATGLAFVYDGMTTEVPSSSRAAFQPGRYGNRWAPLLVAWSTPAASDLLPGGAVVGEGGSTWAQVGSDQPVYVTGLVDVDANATHNVASGFGSGVTMGELLLHELGHVVGLGHTTDTGQIMYPDLQARGSTAYGAGDLTGMSRLGSSAGCLSAPAAG
jgi:hypothetical protein